MGSWKNCSLTSLHHTQQLLDKVRQAGLDPADALKGSSMTSDVLNDLSRKIKMVDEYVIYRNVNAMFPERNISIEIGLKARISVYGLLGYAFLTAETLRDALRLTTEFPALIANGFSMMLEDNGITSALIFSDYVGASDLRIAYAELAVASFKRSCSDLLEQDFPLDEVTFEGAVNADHSTLCQSYLQCPVSHKQPRNMMVFKSEMLNWPLPMRNAVSHGEIIEACRRQNREYAAEREWLQKVKGILEGSMRNPVPLEEVAEHMQCSPRTLRRQLNVFRTSYRQLLDEVRFEKAKQLLREGNQPTEQIAEDLGFCDGASFRRAFQRWSGLAPGAYKA